MGTREIFLRTLGRTGLAVAMVIALVALLAPPGQQVAAQDAGTDATVRFVHASPGTPEVDVIVDGTPVVQGLAFGAATEYAALPSGDHQVQVVPAGQDAAQAVIDTTVTAEGGEAYIVAVTGAGEDLEAQVREVNLDALDPGRARVRMINAVPDGGDVSVAVAGGDTWFDGVGFMDDTDYQEVDAGAYDLELRVADSEEPAFTASGVQIETGTVYDIFALGQVSDSSLALLPVATQVSRPCSDVLGVGTPEDACVRFIHASPDAPAVDVYVGGMASVEGLDYKGVTEFVSIPAGEQQIQVTAAGAPVEDAVIDTTQNLEAGQAYQVFATGTLEEIEATVSEIDLTPLPEGQARLRVIHAASDVEQVDVAVAGGETLVDEVDFRDVTDYTVLDAGSFDLQIRPAGEETELLRAPVEVEASMVYDVAVIGRAEDQSLDVLVLTANTVPREGEVATPAATGAATPAATPDVGAAAPVGTPATAVVTPVEGSPVPASPVAATPENEEDGTPEMGG